MSDPEFEKQLEAFRHYLHDDPTKTEERVKTFFEIVDELDEILEEANGDEPE